MSIILHITARKDWEAALLAGVYTAKSLSVEGFIHCSPPEQIPRVANAFYAGQHGLALLVIDAARLTSELRWEPGTDQPSELFPHIYGALNISAVVDILDFEPGADGKFSLPPLRLND